MKKIIYRVFLVYFVISISLILSVFFDKFSFGFGLGDLGVLIEILVSLIIIGSLVIFGNKKSEIWFFGVLFLIGLMMFYIIYLLTFGRGSEFI